MADFFELREKVARAGKSQGAFAEIPARHDLRFQFGAEADALSDRQLAAGTHQRLPIAPAGAHRPEQKDLYLAAQVLVPFGIAPADR